MLQPRTELPQTAANYRYVQPQILREKMFLRWCSSEVPRPRLCGKLTMVSSVIWPPCVPCGTVGGEELGCRRSELLRLNPHGWRYRSRSLLAFDKSFANPSGGIRGQNSNPSWILENAGNDDIVPRQPESAATGDRRSKNTKIEGKQRRRIPRRL